MRTVTVDFYRDEPTYDSFAECITAIGEEPRAAKADHDKDLLKGLVIEHVARSDEELTLCLEGKILRLSVFLAGVTWSIGEGEESQDRRDGLDCPDILINFPSGSPYHWGRGRLIQSLLHKRIVYLAASKAWVFLTVEGQPTLMFSRLRVRETEKNLLFFSPE